MKIRAYRGPAVASPKSDAERLESIFHPRWCPADDYYVLQAKNQGKNFSFIAGELERPRAEVEQRFHRLRAVNGIERLLEEFGVTDTRYCVDAAETAA